MTEKYLLSIDQGTTGTKALVVDRNARVISQSYVKHSQIYPQSGWVEHDPAEIWECVKQCVSQALDEGQVKPDQIAAIGIDNQGETVMFWNKVTHEPLENAIVWSCRRSADIAEEWSKQEGWVDQVYQKTGLLIDAYFSATKIKWLTEHSAKVQESMKRDQAVCGTLDSWLIWKMTGGKSFKTDPSTACRTLLYNVNTREWDPDILDFLDIHREWLADVADTSGGFGISNPELFCGIEAPIQVSIVDQPAALFGHLCVDKGEAKCTYGTGCFTYLNVGHQKPEANKDKLLSSIVWSKQGQFTFALDGAVYSAGSSVNWAMDSVKLFQNIDELQGWSEQWLANRYSVGDGGTSLKEGDDGLFFIPSLSGIASPYWNSEAKGMWLGFSYNTTNRDLTRAILEGIAHRVTDNLEAMAHATNVKLTSLRVDGGLTENDYLMQYQADILGIPVEIPVVSETTAMGTAYLIGEALKWWDIEELKQKNEVKKVFYPKVTDDERGSLRSAWKRTIKMLDEYYK